MKKYLSSLVSRELITGRWSLAPTFQNADDRNFFTLPNEIFLLNLPPSAFMVYEYLYRQIDDKKVRETIDFLLNREEAHNQMFRDAFNEVQDTGSNRDFDTTKAARMYFSLSNPGPNAFAGNDVTAPKFSK